jgi:hypothetical protein
MNKILKLNRTETHTFHQEQQKSADFKYRRHEKSTVALVFPGKGTEDELQLEI